MTATPNIVEYFALIVWFPISLGLFASFRPAIATMLVLLGAMLFLPVRAAIDFPGLPALDKELTGNFCVLAGTLLFARKKLIRRRVGRGIDTLVFLLMAGAVATVFNNRDPLFYGPTALPAMGTWDAISSSIQQFFNFGIPFVIGRALCTRSRDVRVLLVLLAAAGLLYSLPILFEVRMSPQLHQMVYGHHQHHFRMTLRMGGYRPMVFMPHGLALSVFVLVTAMAATTLARARLKIGPIPAAGAAVYLTGTLALCRSLGALAYGVAILPVIALMRPRGQMRVASLLAVLVIAYPTARTLGVFPTDELVSLASAVSEERADSLRFRFENEDLLLTKALNRAWFGWGTYARNRVYDPETGEDRTITDGFWIIQLGSQGAVGFVGAFGLLLLPIWHAHRRISRIRSRRDRRLIAGLALVLAIYSVDLIPNGFLLSLSIFLAGALMGLVSDLQTDDGRRPRRNRPRRGALPPAAQAETADSEVPSVRDLSGDHRPRTRFPQRAPSAIAREVIGSRR